MSTLKVDAIRHNNATSDAITTHSNGTASAKIIDVGGAQLSHRNKIINGAMTVSQRHGNSSANLTSDNQFATDRWKHVVRGTWNGTYVRSTDAPDNFNYSLKVNPTSTHTPSGSDNAIIATTLEGQDVQDLAFGTSSAKSLTISFYAKTGSTNNGDQYGFQFRSYSPGSGTTRTVTASFTATSSWQRFSFTFAGDTSSTHSLHTDTTPGLGLLWHLAAGPDDIVSQISTWETNGSFRTVTGQSNFLDNTSNEFYLTGVQLEVGDTATSYEHRNFAEELEHCKRYFFVLGKDANRNNTQLSMPFINEAPSNLSGYINFRFQPEMRVAPTVTIGSELQLGKPQVGMSNHKVSAFGGLSPTGSNFFQYTNQTGSTGDSNMYMRIGHHADSYAEFNAEM